MQNTFVAAALHSPSLDSHNLDYFGFIRVLFLCLDLAKQDAGDCIPFDGEVDAGAANGASLLPCFSDR